MEDCYKSLVLIARKQKRVGVLTSFVKRVKIAKVLALILGHIDKQYDIRTYRSTYFYVLKVVDHEDQHGSEGSNNLRQLSI